MSNIITRCGCKRGDTNLGCFHDTVVPRSRGAKRPHLARGSVLHPIYWAQNPKGRKKRECLPVWQSLICEQNVSIEPWLASSLLKKAWTFWEKSLNLSPLALTLQTPRPWSSDLWAPSLDPDFLLGHPKGILPAKNDPAPKLYSLHSYPRSQCTPACLSASSLQDKAQWRQGRRKKWSL